MSVPEDRSSEAELQPARPEAGTPAPQQPAAGKGPGEPQSLKGPQLRPEPGSQRGQRNTGASNRSRAPETRGAKLPKFRGAPQNWK